MGLIFIKLDSCHGEGRVYWTRGDLVEQRHPASGKLGSPPWLSEDVRKIYHPITFLGHWSMAKLGPMDLGEVFFKSKACLIDVWFRFILASLHWPLNSNVSALSHWGAFLWTWTGLEMVDCNLLAPSKPSFTTMTERAPGPNVHCLRHFWRLSRPCWKIRGYKTLTPLLNHWF